MMSGAERHRIAAAAVALDFEVDSGLLCELAIKDHGCAISPVHRVPRLGSSPEGEVLPYLKRMQGDFCGPAANGGGPAQIRHGLRAGDRLRVAPQAR